MRNIKEIQTEAEEAKNAIKRCEIELDRYQSKLDELSDEMNVISQKERITPENVINGKLCISVSELARLLGLSRPKAYEMVSIKGFPALQIGRRIIIPVRQLCKWLEDNAGR